MKKIVIIGGGFCGTITAINLARLSTIPLQISIIDKNPFPCRGIAYSTRNASHLLNVVARNMSALADQPNHFVEWLATRSEYLEEPLDALRARFVPRRVYGDYLHGLFKWYSASVAQEKGIQIEHIRDEVTAIHFEGTAATVALKEGPVLIADKIVLAVGNQPPGPYRLRGLDPQNPRYIGNPWLGWEEKLPAPDETVLLIGTGLTMADTFLTLLGLGWRGKIVAVSRNGLLPLSHFKGFDYPDFLEEKDITLGLRKLFSIFKKHYRIVSARNLNPAILVDKLRPFTQRIWQNLSLREKRQFNRHLRTRWNIMRHRLAPEVHQQLSKAIAEGRLEILQGRLSACAALVDGIRIDIRNKSGSRRIDAGVLINCAGPQENYLASESPLFDSLDSQGAIKPDEMGMGIKVAANFSIPNKDGVDSENLFALGTPLKGTLWETTAVPELRSQAFRVAETIAGQLGEASGRKSLISEVREDVIEYFI